MKKTHVLSLFMVLAGCASFSLAMEMSVADLSAELKKARVAKDKKAIKKYQQLLRQARAGKRPTPTPEPRVSPRRRPKGKERAEPIEKAAPAAADYGGLLADINRLRRAIIEAIPGATIDEETKNAIYKVVGEPVIL